MIKTTSEEKPWVLIKYAYALVLPLGTVGILFGLLALAGYFGNIEALYRPITNGPATNPVTAMSMIFIGFGIRSSSKSKQDVWLQRLFASLVIIITSARFLDAINHSNITALLTPFQSQVVFDLQTGKSNSMGVNSAIMFFFIALSLMLNSFQRFTASQFIAFLAIALPTISFTGYAYGLEQFYGQMSMLTASTGFVLAASALFLTAHVGALKAMLSPYVGGKIARLQTFSGYAIPTILGYLVIKSLSSSDGDLFGIFVVTISWFIILMVSMSAIFQEKTDRERRESERLLALAAMNDQLTGLANRRKFLEFGQEELKRIQRSKSQLWLLMLDIDYFKKINDTSGHAMGDQVLVKISNALTRSVRNIDLVSRIGGEEFTIILTDTSSHGAERIAENIRMNIEKTSIEGWTDIHGPVTVSIGVASNSGSSTLEETIQDADNALYQAKQNGRNQVIFSNKI